MPVFQPCQQTAKLNSQAKIGIFIEIDLPSP